MPRATIKIDPVHELVSLADRMLGALIDFDAVDTPYYTRKLKRLIFLISISGVFMFSPKNSLKRFLMTNQPCRSLD